MDIILSDRSKTMGVILFYISILMFIGIDFYVYDSLLFFFVVSAILVVFIVLNCRLNYVVLRGEFLIFQHIFKNDVIEDVSTISKIQKPFFFRNMLKIYFKDGKSFSFLAKSDAFDILNRYKMRN